MTRPALEIYRGETAHRRFKPFDHAFRYRIAMIRIDVDRLDDAGRTSALFSTGRANLFSFRPRDHGDHGQSTLREWAEHQFARADIDASGGRITLLTFPRHLFYKFAPLSIWLLDQPDGTPLGVIYEVHNTFGEAHPYVARIGSGRSRHETEKRFHVSPFFDVSGRYRFTIRDQEGRFDLAIVNIEDGEPVHSATISAQAMPASTLYFMRIAASMPFSALGVTIAIHWQAAKLWLKGARYRRKPEPPGPEATVAQDV